MNQTKCCANSLNTLIDSNYWETQYQSKTTGWDLGCVSPAIKEYIDTLTNKNKAILIPGCGNSYEAEYLLTKGFKNITLIDIAPTLVSSLKEKFKNNPNIKIIRGDFFEHQGSYDLIIEQTFFCALPPEKREKYVWKTHQLLKKDALLVGLLFNRTFKISPPFGGDKKEYETLFAESFNFLKMDLCLNSVAPRHNSELFIELKKKNQISTNL